MKSYIALLPGLFALLYLYWHWMRGTRFPVARAFLRIYLPTALLLPHQFVAEISLLHWSFAEFAICPIFIAFLFSSEKCTKYSVVDLLLILYVLVCVWSEYWGTHDWSLGIYYVSNRWGAVLSHLLWNAIAPYYLAKHLIYAKGFTPHFARTIITCTIISVFLGGYEWFTGQDLHVAVLENFFGSQVTAPWEASMRFNLVRVAGPYGHPIAFGMGIGIALFWNLWLFRHRFWPQVRFFLGNNWVPALMSGLVLVAGFLATLSRGPIYSFLLALLPLTLGYTKRRALSLSLVSSALIIIAVIAMQMFWYYSDFNRDLAPSDLENNSAYRANLWDVYSPAISEKPWLGWSELEWPKAFHMDSIDNQYLFLQVIHGGIALALFCGILLVVQFRLFRTGMKIPDSQPANRGLNFTLLSQLFMLTICYLTVYMHGQVEVMTFMTIGLAQGFLGFYHE